jgi:phosphoribosylamine--glycine ligase
MGGYTWPEYATSELLSEIESTILQPTLNSMVAEGAPCRGVLYAGLMLTREGPKVLEFNCRFGDPECQLMLPLLQSSLVEVCDSVVDGALRPDDVRWHDRRTYAVVLASRGYPEAPVLGDTISGLSSLDEDVYVFHAGTRRDGDRLVTSSGRVLTLVGHDSNAVYRAAEKVEFSGKRFRRDIGAGMVGVGA